MKWLAKNKLASFGKDTVRVELGPQIIELECNKGNLSNDVTAPHYQIGKIDAFGVKIGTAEMMHCVDWRAKHVPHLWKVYQIEEFEEPNLKTKKMEKISRFIKVNEFEDKAKALAFAGGLI